MRGSIALLCMVCIALAGASYSQPAESEAGGDDQSADTTPAMRFDEHDGITELIIDGVPRVQYIHQYDDSTPETLHETYKVYHHVLDGKGRFITKGSGGLYTHHRGIFLGFNRTEYADRTRDFWHMKDVTQRHQSFTLLEAGPIRARMICLIDWIDDEETVVIHEQRTMTVSHAPGSSQLLLVFESALTAGDADVYLNGDPEHGGFQFRAHNDVAEGAEDVKAQYLFHKDGIDPKEDRDLPWVAMSIGLHDQRHTIQHMNLPGNPTDTIYSAYRDYGRFGAFFTHRIPKGETLSLRYAIEITDGALPARELLAARYDEVVKQCSESSDDDVE